MDSDKLKTDIEITLQENLINDIYIAADAAIACGLERLRNEEGIVPTCKSGCSYCCRFHIPTNIAEAQTLAKYVKRELSSEEINDLRMRTQQWHEWNNFMPGGYSSVNIDEQADLTNYDPCCPLLVNDVCIAYPVRPLICRTHFVCSHPLSCYAANNPESTEDAPEVLATILTATSPFSMTIKDLIEKAGMDFSRSMMLLPHWLAIEMDWDFAISP